MVSLLAVKRTDPATSPPTVTVGATACTLPVTWPEMITSSAANAIRSPSIVPSTTTRDPTA